uniref:Uncharacterized protein n=1 Tax=Anguilla anguilla TaxID=7936 RepID=A0A0E9SEG2_ANGAN
MYNTKLDFNALMPACSRTSQGCPTQFLELYHPEGFHFNPNVANLTLLISS